jgi:hypothetical protein
MVSERNVVQIIGPGGAGKSMLAVQIGLWCFDWRGQDTLAAHPIIPILVDEDTEDLKGVVRRKLLSWLGKKKIEDELLDALFEKQRILVIVDRLSERTLATQRHICSIHATAPINSLLITSREKFHFEGGQSTELYPRALTSDRLLYFLTRLLQLSNGILFPMIDDQLDLAKRLAKLVRVEGKEVPITPLLVRLFFDRAVYLLNNSDPKENALDMLPTSVPYVYFAYLRDTNPKGEGVVNQLTDEATRNAAEALGKESLGDNFVPRDFSKTKARSILSQMGSNESEKLDPIRRLIDNQVLMAKQAATGELLRFVLDPIAEYVAASSYAQEFGNDPAKWKELINKVREKGTTAAGFLTALELVWRADRQSFGWPEDLFT